MKRSFYTLLLSFFAIFCRHQESQPVVNNNDQFPDQRTSILYIIKSGNHYSEQNKPQVMIRNSMSARITFDSSAMYTSVDANNQADVNKLMGFSDCGNDHQQNSARLGWSWTGRKLVLYAYSYVNKTRIIKNLGSFNLNKPIYCSVKAENKYYYFQAGNITDSIPRFCTDYNASRYKLFPYFGGDEVAPHQIRILIAED
jgi:hypothetical protein